MNQELGKIPIETINFIEDRLNLNFIADNLHPSTFPFGKYLMLLGNWPKEIIIIEFKYQLGHYIEVKNEIVKKTGIYVDIEGRLFKQLD